MLRNYRIIKKHLLTKLNINKIKFGLISVSDRASENIYADEGIPTLEKLLTNRSSSSINLKVVGTELIPDNIDLIKEKIIFLIDKKDADVVITTGGTGPSPKDLTPDATLQLIDKELPGFGEYLRRESIKYSKNAILSRQTAGTKGRALILNLPGSPNSILQLLPSVMDQIIHCVEEIKK